MSDNTNIKIVDKAAVTNYFASIDYHSHVPDFLPMALQNTAHDIIDEFDIFKILRILIIIYVYIILRRTYTNYIKKKQVEDQLKADKEQAELDFLNQGAEDFDADASKKEKDDKDAMWGWGKSTRRKVKQQQSVFEEKLKKLQEKQAASGSFEDTAFDPDSDADIEDLLED